MKLVMIVTYSDNATYSNRITDPIEYESKEKAEYDFLCLWEKAKKEETTFEFLNDEYYISDFEKIYDVFEFKKTYKGPEFYELEEWFENFKLKEK
jgi:hypothetical protein